MVFHRATVTKTVGKSSGQDTEISWTLMTQFGRCLREQVWRTAGGFGKHEGVSEVAVTSSQDPVRPEKLTPSALRLS